MQLQGPGISCATVRSVACISALASLGRPGAPGSAPGRCGSPPTRIRQHRSAGNPRAVPGESDGEAVRDARIGHALLAARPAAAPGTGVGTGS